MVTRVGHESVLGGEPAFREFLGKLEWDIVCRLHWWHDGVTQSLIPLFRFSWFFCPLRFFALSILRATLFSPLIFALVLLGIKFSRCIAVNDADEQ